MPELPEVEITVNQLKRKILKRKIVNIWTDNPKMIKKVNLSGKTVRASLEDFKKNILKRKIKNIKRRGKNILIEIDKGIVLIHQKLTGHLLVGKWIEKNKEWIPQEKGPLEEKLNRYIHLIFFLDNGLMVALSDLRKFAKLIFGGKEMILSLPEIKKLGPEPLEKDFTEGEFKRIIQKAKGKIKQVLMDQTVIAGIGNIYSDEILWQAKINPFKQVKKLTLTETKGIYRAMREILRKGIQFHGESIADWRDTEGKKGEYQKIRKVYRREGKLCPRCGTKIQRKKIGGRSAHFCPQCQPLQFY